MDIQHVEVAANIRTALTIAAEYDMELNYTSNSSIANTTDIVVYSKHSIYEMAVLIAVAAVTICWTVYSNLTVIVSVGYFAQLRSLPSNMLIANLAVSDLLLGCLVLPFSAMNDILGYWHFGKQTCYMWLVIGK